MAGTLTAKLSLPALSPPKTSLLTPLSAVAPPRSMAASRLQILVTLETIYEEEDNENQNCVETCKLASSSSSSPPTFLSAQSSMCFLEVQKPLSGYCHNCQYCA
ncbi:hypothetical protein SO802_006843 [Lithocarpus litseifolius]|uniref:Uncharacterized protein n=1 Tax=Lithocarpus litseifolius TaxID=425828 RepID=A0AAW2DR03_9ROSI